MGVEAFIAPLIGAVGSYASAKSEANAAQAQNEETMEFNKREAAKARKWQAQQSEIDRTFNATQQSVAREWADEQAGIAFNRQVQLQNMAQKFNSQEASSARAFDKMMSDTSHQREMADLKMAGLNPILAAGSGAPIGNVVGASVGAGSAPMASGSGAASHNSSASAMAAFSGGHKQNGASILGSLLHSAVEGVHLDNDIKRAKAEVINAEANQKNAETSAKRQVVDERYVNQQIENLKKDNVFKDWQIKSEEEKVNLTKQQIANALKHQLNEDRLTDAQVAQCGAIASAAIQNANTEAAYKATLGKMAVAHNENEKEKLQQQAKELKYKFEEGEAKVKREWTKLHPNWAHTLETVDRVMGAISPIKLKPLKE